MTRERHEEGPAGSKEVEDGMRRTDFEDCFAFEAMVIRVDGISLDGRSCGTEDVRPISIGPNGLGNERRM